MKLKNISLWALMLVATATSLVSCSDDNDPTYLSEVQVSSSYVAISQDGGTTSITVTANDAWQIDTVAASWLTVSPLSGAAGTSTIEFTAPAAPDGRSTELLLTCGGKTQHINVIQGTSTVESATCAEVIAGPESKTYKVRGTCTKIANDLYGNWYLTDATGSIYIYGTLDAKGGTKNFSSLGIEEGDIVTVQGPKTLYKETVELVNVTVLKIEKSLIKVDSVSTSEEIPAAGGTFTAYLTCKGDGMGVTVPSRSSDWLSVVSTTSGTNPVVTFRIAPNTGDSRKDTITFSTTSDGENYSVTTVIKQAAYKLPHGKNPDDPFTVAEALAKCEEIGSTSDDEIYYAKGIISGIKEVSTSYGNATFYISDDGTDEEELTCFRSYSLGNVKFTSEDEIQVGDEVVVCGKLINYKGETPEFSGSVYIYSLKKKGTADPGTLENPFTPEQAAAYIDAGGTDQMYVAGIISKIADNGEFGSQYGNATFFISEDGTYHEDPEQDFEAYRVLYMGNRKWTDGDTQIAVGDKVILYGALTKYKTTYETKQNAAYIYSLNGKTE